MHPQQILIIAWWLYNNQSSNTYNLIIKLVVTCKLAYSVSLALWFDD